MKTIVRRLARDEKGAALVLVLILLLISGLIIGPLLSYMGTGLITGEVYEKRTAELYAADAGVEDAIWKIQHGETPVCPADPEWSYNIADVNGKSVQVTIEYQDDGSFKITSTAITDDGGGTAAITGTAIESYLSALYMDFSALLDNAIVSFDTIDIQSGNEIEGDVWLPDEDDLTIQPPGTEIGEVIDGEVKDSDDMTITWPTAQQLSDYYWEDVKHLETEAYPDGYVINIPPGTTEGDPYVIGPLLAAGDLIIKGSGWTRLEGTIYVKGTLDFNPTPAINIDLNEQTIFAEGEIKLNPGVTLYGSGCIIAIGDIDFQPSIASGGDDFVLVMSITGVVTFNPSGDFTGCVAGNVHVQLQPGCTINWISPEGEGLDFPMGTGGDDELPPVTELRIESWEVSRLSPGA